MAQMNVNEVVARMGESLGHGVQQDEDLARLAVQTLVRLAQESGQMVTIKVGAADEGVSVFAGRHGVTAYGSSRSA